MDKIQKYKTQKELYVYIVINNFQHNLIYDNNFNHNILCYHYHSGAFAWGDARVVLWNACMLVVVGRPLKRWDMEPLVKIILTMTGIHVCFNCISIGLNVEFLIVKDCHCYERLREYLQVVIIAAVILNTLVMCIGIGFFVTHISKCPSTNRNFLQFPLPRSPLHQDHHQFHKDDIPLQSCLTWAEELLWLYSKNNADQRNNDDQYTTLRSLPHSWEVSWNQSMKMLSHLTSIWHHLECQDEYFQDQHDNIEDWKGTWLEYQHDFLNSV